MSMQFILTQDQLRTILDKVAPCAADYDSASILGGVNFTIKHGDLNVVAADGSRLVHYEGKLTAPAPSINQMIVPAALFTELEKQGKRKTAGAALVTNMDDKHVSVQCDGGAIVTGKLINADYPQYADLFPVSGKFQVSGAVAELFNHCKTIRKIDDHTHLVVMRVGAAGAHISMNRKVEFITYSADIKLITNLADGAELLIACNARYLQQALLTGNGGSFAFETDGELKPLVFTYSPSADARIRHLLMPVQYNTESVPSTDIKTKRRRHKSS